MKKANLGVFCFTRITNPVSSVVSHAAEIYTRLQTRTLHFAKYFIFCVIETHSTDNVNYFYLPPLAHGLIDSYTEPWSNDWTESSPNTKAYWKTAHYKETVRLYHSSLKTALIVSTGFMLELMGHKGRFRPWPWELMIGMLLWWNSKNS